MQVWVYDAGSAAGVWNTTGSWAEGQGLGLTGTEEQFVAAQEVFTIDLQP